MSKRTNPRTLRSLKGPSTKSRLKRSRASSSRKEAAVPVIIESDSDDRDTERLNTAHFESEEPTTPPSGIIPLSDMAPSPIVSSCMSSTLSNWASKAVKNTDDQATRQLLGQLARVMPLAGNSSSMATTRNMAFENAEKEAIRGLKKPREPSLSTVSARARSARTKIKGKAKVVVSTFKVSSIIFLPCGTVKGPPPHASESRDEINEDDYIDTIANSKPPTEGIVQSLEEQGLAIRDMNEGYELDSTWDYEDIYGFLRPHFLFLFRYFEEGPNAESYRSSTPFIIVNKSYQTLVALPFKLNGQVLHRNSDTPTGKNGLQLRKLFFVTRHPIPISILTSWSKGIFITLPPSPPPIVQISTTKTRTGRTQSGRRTSAKRKRRAPSTSSSSDSITIIENPPARKRRTCVSAESSASEDTYHNSDTTIDDEVNTVTVNDEVKNDEEAPAEESMAIDNEEWEEYDSTKFGSDVVIGSNAAGPSASSNQAALTATSSEASAMGTSTSTMALREATPVLDDAVTSNLLSPSQRSFSNLNLSSGEDPYGANVDFGFDF